MTHTDLTKVSSGSRPVSPTSTLHESAETQVKKTVPDAQNAINIDSTPDSPTSTRSPETLVEIPPTNGLSPLRKHFLLATFATELIIQATFVDICNVSGVRLTVAQIGQEIGLAPTQAVWVINSYALCLAAFLLLAGRLADIFRPDLLFLGGTATMGALSLGVSFVTNKYGFLALRCLGGLAGSFVIPAAYRLTVGLFPDKTEKKKKLALLSVASGLGGVLGLLLAGAVDWRWFFRIIAIVCTISFTSTWLLSPNASQTHEARQPFKWNRVDIVGSLLIIGSLTTFNLALTEGPIREWKGPLIIVTLILAPLLGIGFFSWERVLNDHRAMLPPSVWRIPAALTSTLVILIPFPFWATTQVKYATWWQEQGISPIMVAVAMLPQGITSLICGVAVQFRPQLVADPRLTIPIAGGFIVVAYILLIFSEGGLGVDYWKFCFPAFVLGSGGAMLVYFASSVNFISNCPSEMAGVAGSWTQVTTHVGGAVCLAIQSAFSGNKNHEDWAISGKRGFIFMAGWTVVFGAQVFVPRLFRKLVGVDKGKERVPGQHDGAEGDP